MVFSHYWEDHDAADVEYACTAPCLRAEESMHMCCGTLNNGGRLLLAGEELLNFEVVTFIILFFSTKKVFS